MIGNSLSIFALSWSKATLHVHSCVEGGDDGLSGVELCLSLFLLGISLCCNGVETLSFAVLASCDISESLDALIKTL